MNVNQIKQKNYQWGNKWPSQQWKPILLLSEKWPQQYQQISSQQVTSKVKK